MDVAISAARGGGYAVSALVAKPSVRAAFAQARKTFQGGCNCGTLRAMATKGTVIKSDPERAKMRDAFLETQMWEKFCYILAKHLRCSFFNIKTDNVCFSCKPHQKNLQC